MLALAQAVSARLWLRTNLSFRVGNRSGNKDELKALARLCSTYQVPLIMSSVVNIGAVIIRMGFGAYDTTSIIRSPQNSIGNQLFKPLYYALIVTLIDPFKGTLF